MGEGLWRRGWSRVRFGVVCKVGALPGPGVNLSERRCQCCRIEARSEFGRVEGDGVVVGNGVLDEIDCGWIAEKSGIHDDPALQQHVSDLNHVVGDQTMS